MEKSSPLSYLRINISNNIYLGQNFTWEIFSPTRVINLEIEISVRHQSKRSIPVFSIRGCVPIESKINQTNMETNNALANEQNRRHRTVTYIGWLNQRQKEIGSRLVQWANIERSQVKTKRVCILQVLSVCSDATFRLIYKNTSRPRRERKITSVRDEAEI